MAHQEFSKIWLFSSLLTEKLGSQSQRGVKHRAENDDHPTLISMHEGTNLLYFIFLKCENHTIREVMM